jgi:hypothetical protein
MSRTWPSTRSTSARSSGFWRRHRLLLFNEPLPLRAAAGHDYPEAPRGARGGGAPCASRPRAGHGPGGPKVLRGRPLAMGSKRRGRARGRVRADVSSVSLAVLGPGRSTRGRC